MAPFWFRLVWVRNIARYAIAGLRYGRLRPLSREELGTLAFWRAMEKQEAPLFISHISFHILRRLAGYAEVQALLDSVDVLGPTRYDTRWTRHLQETTGLTREDCAQIALGSFGSSSDGRILGVQYLVTYDQSLTVGYRNHRDTLDRRLQAMTIQLRAPFDKLHFPTWQHPMNSRAGDPQGPAHPGAGRGHLVARQPVGGVDPTGAGANHGAAHQPFDGAQDKPGRRAPAERHPV